MSRHYFLKEKQMKQFKYRFCAAGFAFGIAVGLALASPAWAQQPDPVLQDVNADWSAVSTAQKHFVADVDKLIMELNAMKKENAELKAKGAAMVSPKAAPTPPVPNTDQAK